MLGIVFDSAMGLEMWYKNLGQRGIKHIVLTILHTGSIEINLVVLRGSALLRWPPHLVGCLQEGFEIRPAHH